MIQTSSVILCLSYIIGLLAGGISWGGYAVLILGVITAFTLPRLVRNINPKIYLIAGIVGFLATLYLQLRMPQPAANDISKYIQQPKTVMVQGVVTSTPRLTRSQRGQFWLKVTRLYPEKLGVKSEKVTGKLYVTVPLLQATGLYPGKTIAISGVLYKPKSATNPGGFDFKAYLAKEGVFAGLRGKEISADTRQRPKWTWWRLRESIMRSQVRFLGSPTGSIVSSMVLGSKAVDLPYDIRDAFIKVGLAHALAASGFQTSLILGVILTLLRRFTVTTKAICGAGALILFLGLSGIQPAVLRAVVMGFAVLIGLTQQRQIKPLGSLLVAATLLLIFNPLWIWDLGFQLSFLATLGLLVTVPPLVKRLDWLPSAIATIIAVPLAASLWTLPLQLHTFGIIPVYSIVLNILSTPLISVISIGGIISAIAGLVWSTAGSALAWLLYYPTQLLIVLVDFFAQLPGNSVAVGRISLWQLIVIYGLMLLAWLQPWWQKRFWLVSGIAIAIALIPVLHSKSTLSQVTVLATTTEPIIVVQDRGKVLLINSGDRDTVRFTVLPFLQQHGISKVESAIAADTKYRDGWQEITKHLPVKTLYVATSHQSDFASLSQRFGSYEYVKAGQTYSGNNIRLIDEQAATWQLQIHNQTWLLLGSLQPQAQTKLLTKKLPPIQVLCWTGEDLNKDFFAAVQPKIAIASANTIDAGTASWLQNNKTRLFWTGRDGAIQKTIDGDFEVTVDATENNAALM